MVSASSRGPSPAGGGPPGQYNLPGRHVKTRPTLERGNMKAFRAALVAAGLSLATGSAALAQDAGKGAQTFKQCSVCHALDHAVVGPALGGVVGRKAGATDGYDYSPLMKAAGDAGLVWSEATLVDYLQDPTAYLTNFAKGKGKGAPGSSKMIFKQSNETARKNVAAYLATQK